MNEKKGFIKFSLVNHDSSNNSVPFTLSLVFSPRYGEILLLQGDKVIFQNPLTFLFLYSYTVLWTSYQIIRQIVKVSNACKILGF